MKLTVFWTLVFLAQNLGCQDGSPIVKIGPDVLPQSDVQSTKDALDLRKSNPDTELSDESPDQSADISKDQSVAKTRDFNIVAFGDTQFSHLSDSCFRSSKMILDQNKNTVLALNRFFDNPSLRWPNTSINQNSFSLAGDVFAAPKFLLLAGDITESADSFGCEEWSQFLQLFPVGEHEIHEPELSYPTFETMGNHDFPFRNTLEKATDSVTRISRRIEARHEARSSDILSQTGENILLVKQEESRGAYRWKFNDVYFFNLNVKPSGGGKDANNERLFCGAKTNLVHKNNDGSVNDLPTALKNNQCAEYKVKEGKYRVIHPQYALDFLEEAAVENTQIVVTTHYGPRNQTRLANDELKNFCTILEKKRLRVVAWLVGHTHRSDYYEWTCGGYDIPVFNVGSGFTKAGSEVGTDNSGEIHFSLLRFGERWMEAIDIGYNPIQTIFRAPGSSAVNEGSCTSAKGNLKDTGVSLEVPYQMKNNADFDSAPDDNDRDRDQWWCNPDGLYGGWQVRSPICPVGIAPYLGAEGLSKNPECF